MISVRLISKKNYLFWILNISGWLSLYLLILILFYRDNLFNYKTVAGLALTYITGFIISLGLRLIYRRIGYTNRPIIMTAIWIILICILFTNVWYFFDALISIILVDSRALTEGTFSSIAGPITSRIPTLIAWSGFYYIINLWYEWNSEKQRAEKADILAQKAQLQMLRYQLNPHFLFNSLNTIKALVEEDKHKAKEVITELAEFLRYSLLSKNFSNVPLKNELEAIKHYFEIQKIRYEEKLEVFFNIDKTAEEFPVLSFLIYPIVENAVKYGMKTSELPLVIRITARVINYELEISIENTGKWINENDKVMEIDKGTGTGIENVKARLENAFKENFSFIINQTENKVIVKIKIRKT